MYIPLLFSSYTWCLGRSYIHIWTTNQTSIRFFSFFLFKTYLFERDREREWVGGRGRRETFPADSPLIVEPNMGFSFQTHEIRTWAETKSPALYLLSHAGVPRFLLLTWHSHLDFIEISHLVAPKRTYNLHFWNWVLFPCTLPWATSLPSSN